MNNTFKTALVGGVLVVGALVGLAPTASANPVPGHPNCVTDPWGFLGLTQKRIICDGPIQGDGSWMRRRWQGTPAHYVSPSSSCSYGSYSSYCSYSQGGWVDDDIKDDETYVVTPDTIVPGEPGHLG